MRLLPHFFMAAVTLALPALAMPTLPVTYTDALAKNVPSDVIGDPDDFDIYKLTFTSFNASTKTFGVEILFNYGGGSSLNSFSVGGRSLNVGDLLFYQGDKTYAVALKTHNSLTAGNLYQVTGTRTAGQVLNTTPTSTFNFRPDEDVWGVGTGATKIGNGSVTVTKTTAGGVLDNNNGLKVTLSFAASDEFIAGFAGSEFSFASATCGNDMLTGTLPGNPVPEPGTWAMLGAGLVGLAAIRRRKAA